MHPNKSSRSLIHLPHRSNSGFALVLVLFIVALLAGILIFFLARSLSTNLIAYGSVNFTASDLYGHGTIDQIIADLRQEIAAGSTATSIGTGAVSTIYRPTIPSAAEPYEVGPASYTSTIWNSTFPNLLKESTRGIPFYPTSYDGNAPTRAAPLNSFSDPDRTGRYISLARWNRHLLLPKNNSASNTDFTPTTTPPFVAPDWILTAADGFNPTTLNTSPTDLTNSNVNPKSQGYIVGRYAYAIYNEGGLLDANVAGCPSPTIGTTGFQPPGSTAAALWSQAVIIARRGTEGFADLTQLPGINAVSSITPQHAVDQLVGWRNPATSQVAGTGNPPSYAFSATSINNYLGTLLSLTTQNLTTANTALSAGGETDRQFSTRQQLITFLESLAGANSTDQANLQNSLQYLGTFTRALNRPSYWPDPNRPKVVNGPLSGGNNAQGYDLEYNPPFASIRVSTGFQRLDGTAAQAGDPLVSKRFPLNRLVWITYKGPSANNMSDPAVQQSILALGGNPTDTNDPIYQFVAQGTLSNIQKYFGLTWKPDQGNGVGPYWAYDQHSGAPQSPGTIARLDQIAAAGRDPDFFELLQAAICCGSLGTSDPNIGTHLSNDDIPLYTWQLGKDGQVGVQVLQIGANMINQVSPTDFPVHIVFTNTSYTYSLWGSTDLPYFADLFQIGFSATTAVPPAPGTPSDTLVTPGWGAVLDIPSVWNPYAYNSATPVSSGFMPTALRISASECVPSTLGLKASFGFTAEDSTGNPISSSDAPWGYGTLDATGTVITPSSGPNNCLYFTNALNLYREPTPLYRPNTPASVHIDNSPNRKNTIINAEPANWASGIPELGTSNLYLGFYLLFYNLRHNQSGQVLNVSMIQPGGDGAGGQSYSLEYQPPGSSEWIPYQQYDLSPEYTHFKAPYNAVFSPTNTIMPGWPHPDQTWFAELVFDPRTNRFGTCKDQHPRGFVDSPNNTITYTRWPPTDPDATSSFESTPAATQNILTLSPHMTDPDGVVRRAMGGYASSTGTTPTTVVGLPMTGTTPVNPSSRPIILHRPFRSVAELGYVFSDTPWKNIDFFSSESGDGGLLDVFCIKDDDRPDALSAGRLDLNSRQTPVFQALLAGAYRDELTPTDVLSAGSTSEASSVATALVKRTTSNAQGKGPLMNVADLVGRYTAGFSNDNGQHYDGFSTDLGACYTSPSGGLIQRFREASMRALVDAGQAGTWNLLIDVVAQVGRYPTGSTKLTDFLVTGERHYWVHIAIDRTTDQVIDENIESVNE